MDTDEESFSCHKWLLLSKKIHEETKELDDSEKESYERMNHI